MAVRMTFTGRYVSNERCTKSRWKPTVTPRTVAEYIPKRIASSVQWKPQPHKKMIAVTKPTNGTLTPTKVAILPPSDNRTCFLGIRGVNLAVEATAGRTMEWIKRATLPRFQPSHAGDGLPNEAHTARKTVGATSVPAEKRGEFSQFRPIFTACPNLHHPFGRPANLGS